MQAALRGQKDRWHRLFNLAWMDRGLHINLNDVDDEALGWLEEWAVEESEKLRQKYPT